MPRLTDKERKDVVVEYRAGKSQTDIAKKLNVSVAAVSKILNKAKSKNCETKVKLNKTQREMSDEIVEKATVALLEKNYDKMSPETLVKIIERMTFVYKDAEKTEPITAIEVRVVDGAKDDTED